MRQRFARGEKCGILFGRERNGLETSEVAVADALIMIPVNSRFASLNLAQAVLLLGYSWMRDSGHATLGRVTNYETPVQSGLNLGSDRPANKEELFGFFEHIEAELDRMGFFNPGGETTCGGAESPDYVYAFEADRAGDSEPSWHSCNAGERQRPRSQDVHMSRHHVAKF